MFDRTPSGVDVTIDGETRTYEAFVTTAPAGLDRASTVHIGGIELCENRPPCCGADHVRRHARPTACAPPANCQRRLEAPEGVLREGPLGRVSTPLRWLRAHQSVVLAGTPEK